MKGQVSSPDLRCLKVGNNGEVTLTWLTPKDQSNQFNCYLIYGSTFKIGPFNLIDSIFSYNTTSYTHMLAKAGAQSKYYFIRTRYNNGGLSLSPIKDTLQSIWLNVLSPVGLAYLKLQYNDLHNPKLTTSNTFTITREFPIGTFKALNVTPDVNYADTLSVCTASLFYKVAMSDLSGCLSESNSFGGLYGDTKSPDQVILDSISVLPNGSTVLAWKLPTEKDIVKYEIQQKTIAGINVSIDTLKGINNTIYTYTQNLATFTTVSLFVGAIDSCNNGNTPYNYSITTMFLSTKYYSCDYKTELNWNSYLSMPRGIKEYQIFYSEDGGTFTKIGSTTLTAFTHTQVSPGKIITYFIRVINFDKSITASSNRVSFLAYLVPSPAYLYMPSISVSSKTSVQVKFLIDTSKESNGVDLYRSEDGNNFKPVTLIPYNKSPILIYNDENIKPYQKSYYYKGQIRDSCGNSRIVSNISKTVLLKVSNDNDQIYTKHLNWNEYEGFAAGINSYRVYRVINDVVETNPIAVLNPSITNFSDNIESAASLGSKIEYYIETLESFTGNPFGFSEKSNSNLADVYMEESIFIPTAFAPNGTNNKWMPITNFVDKAEYNVRVFDRWGHPVFQTNSNTEAWDGKDLPDGLFVYIVSYKNSRGEYKEIKGTIVLIR